jgi:hypothetical protein
MTLNPSFQEWHSWGSRSEQNWTAEHLKDLSLWGQPNVCCAAPASFDPFPGAALAVSSYWTSWSHRSERTAPMGHREFRGNSRVVEGPAAASSRYTLCSLDNRSPCDLECGWMEI